jgi:RNA polymerase sigma-70 factor (ECF subfamily)
MSSPASAPDKKTQWLLDRYVEAWKNANVEGLVALLKQDAILAMPPSPSWYRGRTQIAEFSAATLFKDDGMFPGKALDRWKLLPTRANAAPAFAIYQRDENNQYRAFGLHVLICNGDSISQIIIFIDPDLPSRFGLPATVT